MYRYYRKRANLSIEEAAELLHIAPRTLCKYEADEVAPNDVALKMAEVYKAPEVTVLQCKKKCPIGSRYCYELLNNVDTSPSAIINKYRQEDKESGEAIENLAILMLNKKGEADCAEEELKQIWRWSLELLDLEHVIETMKLRLWDFIPVDKLIAEHNKKCIDKCYVKSELKVS